VNLLGGILEGCSDPVAEWDSRPRVHTNIEVSVFRRPTPSIAENEIVFVLIPHIIRGPEGVLVPISICST